MVFYIINWFNLDIYYIIQVGFLMNSKISVIFRSNKENVYEY